MRTSCPEGSGAHRQQEDASQMSWLCPMRPDLSFQGHPTETAFPLAFALLFRYSMFSCFSDFSPGP